MLERLASGLVIAAGVISVGVGLVSAAQQLHVAGRIYRKTETLYDAVADGWASWFVEGFSVFAVGRHWVRASLLFVGWSVAGICFIGLGIQLLARV